ncbi:hypothetical protein AaE_011377 [Aphanomyces astaci]|uniref:EF-hand domain-containing protein n=1 Tax=Aphanomyces astaci TaxID=112090 RepID=A0A6A4ZZ53_APHAT|nr:hypothetical protein AaE_011377 [Aphanomyces astaci]
MRRGTVKVEYCPIRDQVVVLEGDASPPRLCRQSKQVSSPRPKYTNTATATSIRNLYLPFSSIAAKCALHPLVPSSSSSPCRPLTSTVDTRRRPVPACPHVRVVRSPPPTLSTLVDPTLLSDQPQRDDESETKNHNKELLWLRHRWFTKHGQPSRMKEDRAKMVLMRRWFEFLDTDGSGEIGLNELEDPLVSVGLARCRLDVRQLIQTVDDSDNGEVNFDEFLSMMRGQTNVAMKQPRPPLSAPKSVVPTCTARGHECATEAVTLPSPRISGDDTNSVVRLFSDLQEGKLGDLTLPFPILITAYRRRMLLNAHMAPLECDRSQGHSVLTALEVTRREAAIQDEEDEIQRAQQRQRRTSMSYRAGDALRREDVEKLSTIGSKTASNALCDGENAPVVRQVGNSRQLLRLPDLYD